MKPSRRWPPNLFFRVVGVSILIYEATLWPSPQGEVVLAAIGLLGTPEFLRRDGEGSKK